MYKRSDMLEANGDLFVIKRKFKIEQFQKVLDHFGPKRVSLEYHCELILRGADGYFYLCDKVDDARIV